MPMSVRDDALDTHSVVSSSEPRAPGLGPHFGACPGKDEPCEWFEGQPRLRPEVSLVRDSPAKYITGYSSSSSKRLKTTSARMHAKLRNAFELRKLH